MAGIKDDITTLKTKEATLTDNKVVNFAYETSAYDDDRANGVEEYDYEADNNIPKGTAEILDINTTVLEKGFRSQAGSVTRMLVNHFFGRMSYNLNKTVDVVNGLLTSLKDYIGEANGIASLDSDGRIPYEQLPESAVEFKGTWNADTNTPTLEDGTGRNGDFYIVSVGGRQFDTTFYANDRIIYDGNTSKWERLEGNVPKVPVGFVYQQLYNPTEGEWEASPVDMYPANLWQLITEDFLDYPFLKATYNATFGSETKTGLGHNAEHSHNMEHKHRMEHSHDMSHTHKFATFSVAIKAGSGLSGAWTGGSTGTTQDADPNTTAVSSYNDAYTGGSVTISSTTESETSETSRVTTDASGSGNSPEPDWTGMRIWRCIG